MEAGSLAMKDINKINSTIDMTAPDSLAAPDSLTHAVVNSNSTDNSTDTEAQKDKTSAILFVAGVISARIGML